MDDQVVKRGDASPGDPACRNGEQPTLLPQQNRCTTAKQLADFAPRWKDIAKYFRKRSETDVKNIYYSSMRLVSSDNNLGRRLLSSYANAVRDCHGDPFQRRAALEAKKAEHGVDDEYCERILQSCANGKAGARPTGRATTPGPIGTEAAATETTAAALTASASGAAAATAAAMAAAAHGGDAVATITTASTAAATATANCTAIATAAGVRGVADTAAIVADGGMLVDGATSPLVEAGGIGRGGKRAAVASERPTRSRKAGGEAQSAPLPGRAAGRLRTGLADVSGSSESGQADEDSDGTAAADAAALVPRELMAVALKQAAAAATAAVGGLAFDSPSHSVRSSAPGVEARNRLQLLAQSKMLVLRPLGVMAAPKREVMVPVLLAPPSSVSGPFDDGDGFTNAGGDRGHDAAEWLAAHVERRGDAARGQDQHQSLAAALHLAAHSSPAGHWDLEQQVVLPVRRPPPQSQPLPRAASGMYGLELLSEVADEAANAAGSVRCNTHACMHTCILLRHGDMWMRRSICVGGMGGSQAGLESRGYAVCLSMSWNSNIRVRTAKAPSSTPIHEAPSPKLQAPYPYAVSLGRVGDVGARDQNPTGSGGGTTSSDGDKAELAVIDSQTRDGTSAMFTRLIGQVAWLAGPLVALNVANLCNASLPDWLGEEVGDLHSFLVNPLFLVASLAAMYGQRLYGLLPPAEAEALPAFSLAWYGQAVRGPRALLALLLLYVIRTMPRRLQARKRTGPIAFGRALVAFERAAASMTRSHLSTAARRAVASNAVGTDRVLLHELRVESVAGARAANALHRAAELGVAEEVGMPPIYPSGYPPKKVRLAADLAGLLLTRSAYTGSRLVSTAAVILFRLCQGLRRGAAFAPAEAPIGAAALARRKARAAAGKAQAQAPGEGHFPATKAAELSRRMAALLQGRAAQQIKRLDAEVVSADIDEWGSADAPRLTLLEPALSMCSDTWRRRTGKIGRRGLPLTAAKPDQEADEEDAEEDDDDAKQRKQQQQQAPKELGGGEASALFDAMAGGLWQLVGTGALQPLGLAMPAGATAAAGSLAGGAALALGTSAEAVAELRGAAAFCLRGLCRAASARAFAACALPNGNAVAAQQRNTALGGTGACATWLGAPLATWLPAPRDLLPARPERLLTGSGAGAVAKRAGGSTTARNRAGRGAGSGGRTTVSASFCGQAQQLLKEWNARTPRAAGTGAGPVEVAPAKACANPRCGRLSGPTEASLKPMQCSGCRTARYCCQGCQLEHWKAEGHKQECARGG
eukprot:XP_001702602.1 predicted protein [Chlamydomonas reinhardtii]